MMRALLGSALGGVVAGAVALVATAQGRAPEPAWSQSSAAAPYVQTAAGTQGLSPLAGGAPALVQCEPQQEAVLQRAFVGGREVAQVICVPRQAMQPMPYSAVPYASPVGYTQAVAYGQPDIVERPVVRTQTVRRRVVRETAPKRSWQKTALVIGGSAGAGAGVGAIAGGKKGALIGAAIGGGAASIFEALKRR